MPYMLTVKKKVDVDDNFCDTEHKQNGALGNCEEIPNCYYQPIFITISTDNCSCLRHVTDIAHAEKNLYKDRS